jgi:hypothetical protein
VEDRRQRHHAHPVALLSRARTELMAESHQFQTMQYAAAGLHELFDSYMKAGFTRQEAFELVRSIMMATVANQRPPSPEK